VQRDVGPSAKDKVGLMLTVYGRKSSFNVQKVSGSSASSGRA